MDTKKLRQKILDLAIRGKLVPQDPNDEPASVLLERIRAEKERLINEGKIKRSKKTATDDEIEAPFEIPESWEWVRLEDFVMAITDGDHQPPPQSKTGVPFLVISDVNTGVINFSNARFVSEEYYNNLPAIRRVAKGDILFTVTGSYGITILVDTEQNFCFQRHIGLIKTISCSEWITAVLKSDCVQKYCDKVATGTAQKTVSLGHLRDLVIPVPPLSEQKRIITEVERWLAVINTLESNEGDLLKAVDQAKSKILDLAIHGKLVPQDPNDEPASVLLAKIRKEKEQLVKAGKLKKKDLEEIPISEDEKPFEIPESWEWVRWGALGEYKKGPFGSSLTKSMFVPKSDKAIKVYEQKNAIQKDYSLGEYYISEEKYEEMKGFTIHPGDIIVSCAGTIGETYLLPQEAPVGIINQALMRAKIHLESIIPYWLLYFRYILLIENRLKGAGSAIKNIPPFEVLKAMPVALPPLAEQKRIVAKIEEVFKEIDKLKK